MNFSPKLEDSTDEQLLAHINNLLPAYGVLASDELTRRMLSKLQTSLDRSSDSSEKLARANYRLQIFVAVLTGIGTIVVLYPTLQFIFNWAAPILSAITNFPQASISVVNSLSGVLSGGVAVLIFWFTRQEYEQTREMLKKDKERFNRWRRGG